MTDKRDTDRVPISEVEVRVLDVEALLDLLDGLASRGLMSRCTRVEAGSASVTLTAAGEPPPDPRKLEKARQDLDETTLFDAS
jgi:hypothetical protein